MKQHIIALITVLILSFTSSRACTVFMASDNTHVLVGNNEDNTPTLKSYLWFYPAEYNKHGYVTWGNNKRMPEGGMNTKGLFWDAAALPTKIPIVSNPAKTNYVGYFVAKALSECASVEEVIALVSKYNLVWQEKAQILVADASGDCAIIHANYIVRKADLQQNYMALANFCLKDSVSKTFQCYRYGYANSILATKPSLSVDLFKKILEKTAQMDNGNATLYSQVCNLKSGNIHLFQRYDFNEEKMLNLEEELKKGSRTIEIKSLFLKNIAEELEPLFAQKDYASAVSKYNSLKNLAQSEYNFSIRYLDELGFKFLNNNKLEEATEVFKLNQSQYLTSHTTWASLGLAYLRVGDQLNAQKALNEALKLNPESYVANLFAKQKRGVVTFKIPYFEGVEKLALAGTFNDFSNTTHLFERNKDNAWVCKIKLKPGQYRYKLVVGSGNWHNDPFNHALAQNDKYWDNWLLVQ